jgi:hypothetical protein
MTCLEKFMKEKAEPNDTEASVLMWYCPSESGYLPVPEYCETEGGHEKCVRCWHREIPEEKDTIEEKFTIATPIIKDSGDRTQFETGAVRDMREGKGRCDLMPLDIIARYIEDDPDKPDFVLWHINLFQAGGSAHYLFGALNEFANKRGWDPCTMFLETAIHFEEGAKKYGENNWQKGIPVYCYIDSAVRHYLKWHRGDTDEPHDRAFVWNILCAMWTWEHMPEMNSYVKEK